MRLLLPLGLVAAAYYYAGKRIMDLQYNVQGIRINTKKTNFTTLALELDLAVLNPNNSDLKLKSFNGVLTYNGAIISYVNINTPITISKTDTTVIVVPLKVQSIMIATEVFSAILKGNSLSKMDLAFRLKGQLRIERLLLPINQLYELNDNDIV